MPPEEVGVWHIYLLPTYLGEVVAVAPAAAAAAAAAEVHSSQYQVVVLTTCLHGLYMYKYVGGHQKRGGEKEQQQPQ